jgi:FkbM family methyltransferase
VNENIGFSLWHLGIYDLVVSEVLWRLLDRGEHAIDVGANLGYMTSLLAARVGENGKVSAFEPHPQIFNQLKKNHRLWQGKKDLAQIELVERAAAAQKGSSTLMIPLDFSQNTGTAFIAGAQEVKHAMQSIPIELITLDDFFAQKPSPKLAKIDTEGSELSVLQGASGILAQRTLRDIIFESHEQYPNPVTQLLEDFGYQIFRLEKNFLGPKLVRANQQREAFDPTKVWEAESYLATLDTKRALTKMKPLGWNVLHP